MTTDELRTAVEALKSESIDLRAALAKTDAILDAVARAVAELERKVDGASL